MDTPRTPGTSTYMEGDRDKRGKSLKGRGGELDKPGTSVVIQGPGDAVPSISGGQSPAVLSTSTYVANITDAHNIHVGPVIEHKYFLGGTELPIGSTGQQGSLSNISRGLTESIHRQTKIQKQSDIYRRHCQKKTGGTFVKTTPYFEAERLMQDERSILLIGDSGDGKSSILCYLVANTECTPVECAKPEDVESYINQNLETEEQLLFVFDDSFGKFIQHTAVNNWINMIEKLEKFLDSHKFMFATRRTVWADCKVHLQESPFFCNIVEVTVEKLSTEDRRMLLECHLGANNKVTEKEMEDMVHVSKPIAYSQCCKLVGDALRRGESGTQLIKIFERPFSFISSELRKMSDKEKEIYATLCLVMLCGGELKCKELTGSSSDVSGDFMERMEAVCDACSCTSLTRGGILKLAQKLSGTYLEKKQITGVDHASCEVYTFSHDSIHEAMIMMYGENHFGQCLKFIHHDIIVSIVRPQIYNKPVHECAVNVPVDYYSEVAKLFTNKAVRGKWDLHDVFQNPCVRDEEFQHLWCTSLKSSPDDLDTLCQSKSWDGQCLWDLVGRSGADKLWQFLHGRGIKCDCRTDSSGLSTAASRDQMEMVKDIMSSHRQADDQICHAVIAGCSSGSTNTLKFLLPHVNTEKREEIINRGMLAGCLNGHQEVVELLLQSPCLKEKCGCGEGLTTAAERGHRNIVHILLSHGANINTTDNYGWTALHRAAGSGHVDTVDYLLSQGADMNMPDKDGGTCLRPATYMGHTDTVRYLITKGAQVNRRDTYGRTCLHLSAFHGHTDTLSYLLTQGADLNSTDNEGQTCLHRAALNGHTETVHHLVSQGADVNATSQHGNTCLQGAVYGGHTDTVRCLVKLGAKINITDDDGDTSLHEAARYGHTNIVRALVEEGALINAGNTYGVSPLHRAAYWCHRGAVSTLLENGADVNMTDKWEQTPLHAAMRRGLHLTDEFTCVLDILLKHGVDINKTDKWGLTALYLAKQGSHTAALEVFCEHGHHLETYDEGLRNKPDETDKKNMNMAYWDMED